MNVDSEEIENVREIVRRCTQLFDKMFAKYIDIMRFP